MPGRDAGQGDSQPPGARRPIALSCHVGAATPERLGANVSRRTNAPPPTRLPAPRVIQTLCPPSPDRTLLGSQWLTRKTFQHHSHSLGAENAGAIRLPDAPYADPASLPTPLDSGSRWHQRHHYSGEGLIHVVRALYSEPPAQGAGVCTPYAHPVVLCCLHCAALTPSRVRPR